MAAALAERTTSGLTIDDATAVIGLLITIATIVGGFVVNYFLKRRGTSGKVQNSAADILWAQAQQMREMLLAEKKNTEGQLDKVAEQRDRLLNSHATQVIPMLEGVNESLGQIAVGHAALVEKVDDLLSKVDEILEHIPDGKERPRGPAGKETARDHPANHRGPRSAG